MRRRQLVAALGTAVVGGFAGCSGRTDGTPDAFRISSPALVSGGALPDRFTCYGAGDSPPFTVERVPEPTAAVAVVASYDSGGITDPVFWTLWNVPPDVGRIPAGLPRTASVESLDGAGQGRPEDGRAGYEPPCPKVGQSYTNRFQLYALGERLELTGGTDHDTATEAIGDAVLASRRITVDFEPTPTP